VYNIQKISLSYIFGKLKLINANLLIISLLIFIAGVFTLYSAGKGNFHPFAVRQVFFFFISLVVVVVVICANLEYLAKFSYLIYFLSLMLLVYIDFFGHRSMGAVRWIKFLGFSIQPSELMKVSLLFALAKYFENKKIEQVLRSKTLVIPLILIVLPIILVLKQPDLGTAVILFGIGISVLFIVGVQWWKFAICFVVFLSFLPFIWNYGLHAYQKKRVEVFLGIIEDKRGDNYNLEQSKIAVGSGGAFGKGYLKGSQNQLSFLPEKQTDFIFAIFIEENGFFCGFLLITMYLMLIGLIFWISISCVSNKFNKILSFGIGCIFFIHSFVNIGMVMGSLPVVGIPLPFMSLGGTMTIISFFMVALALNIDMKNR
jgi:rod shape determining protein RodA